MRLGSIDVGTNSCRMLVVDYTGNKLEVLKKGLVITRLGEGVDKNLGLTAGAIERTSNAIINFLAEMKDLELDNIRIIGTSALRDVKNAELLINKVKDSFNVPFDVISGEEEARLNYLANKYDNKNAIIIDIGGGSTEFIWEKGKEILYKSLDMGSVRMTERFISDTSGKASKEELADIKRNVLKLMDENIFIDLEIDKLVGLGGTITTLTAIELALEEYDSEKIEGHLLKSKTIKEILLSLSNKTLTERKQIRGLQPGRADVIIAGTVILDTIMDKLEIEEILTSEYDLLYGVIEEMKNKMNS